MGDLYIHNIDVRSHNILKQRLDDTLDDTLEQSQDNATALS